MKTGPDQIAGHWKGLYFYDHESQRLPDGSGVGFELQLSQFWLQRILGWFSGTVADDPVKGMPEEGRISGSLRGTVICFTKRMPVSYCTHEGERISVREWLKRHGFDPGRDFPHPPIFYRGVFSSADAATGTWQIRDWHLDLGPRGRIPVPGCTGKWELAR